MDKNHDYIRRILAKAQFTGNFQDAYPTAQIHALIDTVPAEDVQPVVRGKWIFDCERRQGDGWIYKQRHCSACGFQTVECLNYCQKCGAKMDSEDDDA